MSGTAVSSFHIGASELGAPTVIMTPRGPALKTALGTFNVLDLVSSHCAFNEIIKLAHLNEASEDRCHWSMESDLSLYDFMCSFGAAAEDDEDIGDGEYDNRDLPRDRAALEAPRGSAGSVSILPAGEASPFARTLAA